MELLLIRTYYPDGTNGELYANNGKDIICHTIELPWKDNEHSLSCIPEGRYGISMRFTKKRDWHMLVKGVLARSLILIHPANDAERELKGCIAPVTTLTGEGRGTESRPAFETLKELISNALKNEPVFLTIKTQ